MKAAVVTSFETPPRCGDVDEPVPGDGEIVVQVLAAGLHQRVRSQADGSHYTSIGRLPLVPGIDGVARTAEGELRYFVLDDTTHGSMAERVAIDPRRSVVLPDTADPVAVAAAMNPAMSSWIALRRRLAFRAGDDVLVLGATGSAGGLAVQVARLLGAARVVAAGRDALGLATRPPRGATVTSGLGGDGLAAVAADVDVVLDYLWGEPAASAMTALVTARTDRTRPLTWVALGSAAGRAAPVPSAALRASQLTLVGSGQGSVGTREIVAELPAIARAVIEGRLQSDADAVPLSAVREAWGRPTTDRRRVVLVPGS